jgi:GxxExxY protein
MNTDEEGMKDVTERVIGCAFRAANALGSGFLEKVYENAMAHELRKAGVIVSQQYAIIVRCDNVVVGDDNADLLVEKSLLVELKCVRAFNDINSAQCLNYP